MSEENGNILDLGSIDFTPAWAKKEAGVSVGKVRDQGSGFRDQGSGIRDQKRTFGDKKPFGERKPFGPKKPFGDKKPSGGKPFDRRPRFEDRPKPLDVEVKVLPETKALGTIIRKLQGDAHAYKLKDLAYFFLDNPSSVLLKITPKKNTPVHSTPTPSTCAFKIHTPRVCVFCYTCKVFWLVVSAGKLFVL